MDLGGEGGRDLELEESETADCVRDSWRANVHLSTGDEGRAMSSGEQGEGEKTTLVGEVGELV